MKNHTKPTKSSNQVTIENYPQPIELADAELEAVAGGMYGGGTVNGEATDPHVQDAPMMGGGLGMGGMNPF